MKPNKVSSLLVTLILLTDIASPLGNQIDPRCLRLENQTVGNEKFTYAYMENARQINREFFSDDMILYSVNTCVDI